MHTFSKASILIILIGLSVLFCSQTYSAVEDQNQTVKPWKELDFDARYSVDEALRFYSLKTENGSRASLVVLDLNNHKYDLRPFFCDHLTAVSEIAKQEKALAAINGGFFNLNNGESTSYIVINGKEKCDPKQNKALVENPALKSSLETILNRSELRILQNAEGEHKAKIVHHNDPIPKGWSLLHSLQAGPELIPTLADVDEAFVRQTDKKTIDAIGSHKQAARSAVGITHDNHVMFLAVASRGQEEFSSGVTLAEFAKMLSDLGCTHALNLDGGTSTTLVVSEGDFRDPNNYALVKVISGSQEKLVKSGLIITKSASKSTCPYTMPQ